MINPLQDILTSLKGIAKPPRRIASAEDVEKNKLHQAYRSKRKKSIKKASASRKRR